MAKADDVTVSSVHWSQSQGGHTIRPGDVPPHSAGPRKRTTRSVETQRCAILGRGPAAMLSTTGDQPDALGNNCLRSWRGRLRREEEYFTGARHRACSRETDPMVDWSSRFRTNRSSNRPTIDAHRLIAGRRPDYTGARNPLRTTAAAIAALGSDERRRHPIDSNQRFRRRQRPFGLT
jgi:hypothetical protein